ncbi:winged helix DNA-binding domain-containing protein [Streptomyces sp. WI04-05B]|uniref:winged helix DNA-binding domain-containing protein n=1 Tax=Streptomyces TaxID=1883 RepID=UPI0029B1DB6F|nr:MULTISPECIES: winged helix DNA-binding domain-containing protein [unclassified Streptomyces]MDX2543439.1 winged helix DNA-binding domain-containing protein [Streptomyces sp. WI04-05B]MDX2589108.1 winged helix DNA-binding domain-containing protein [Streptomyces sp. WI04-05A]MDX3746611.1 winged helix DNA-binding domain-containing protein [Streptomyces sp. AK08-02]
MQNTAKQNKATTVSAKTKTASANATASATPTTSTGPASTAVPAPAPAAAAAAPVLGPRALNRATLARQLLLTRSPMSAKDALTHLLGLQAQNVKPPYYALAARLDGFVPEDLSRLMADREAVRIVTMRSTIHTHTADDCLTLRPLVQPARDRELTYFRKGLVGVDLDRLTALARDLVEEAPRTMGQLREALLVEWPDADPQSLSVAARCRLPLVQVTPRGLWGRSGQVALTTAEHWLGRAAEPDPAAPLDTTVLRYLAAFGPASVKDMQTWAGLTRLRDAFERLRPRLLTFRDEHGTELFDLPDAPRPDQDTPAPPRFLPEFDNLLLSHADRTRVVPADLKGRSWSGNQAHRVLLVDGFLAGLWHLTDGTLTVEPFGDFTKDQRAAVAEEGERMLAVLHEGTAYDIRFAPAS